MDYIGIDLYKNSSQVCILTEDGELIERRIKTDKRLEEIVKADAAVQRLCSVPGVGPVVAYHLRRHPRRCVTLPRGQAGALLPRAGAARVQFRRAAAPRPDQ